MWFFIILVVVLLIVVFWYYSKKRILINAFKRGNTIVFGKKGKGKDLLTQYVINCRKKEYLSNIDYGGKRENVALIDVSCPGNTYENLILENYIKSEAKDWENRDIYISDAGIYLPSQYDTKLYKTYPSLPIYYALSRHLYNNNVHCNTQNLGRVWKALREQADAYFKCIRTYKIGPILIVKWIYYDKYESAEKSLLPMRKKLFKSSDLYEQYRATNGEIVIGYSIIRKKSIKYDTRVFRTYLLENY